MAAGKQGSNTIDHEGINTQRSKHPRVCEENLLTNQLGGKRALYDYILNWYQLMAIICLWPLTQKRHNNDTPNTKVIT